MCVVLHNLHIAYIYITWRCPVRHGGYPSPSIVPWGDRSDPVSAPQLGPGESRTSLAASSPPPVF